MSLDARLRGLAPVQKGYRRVFRGQGRDYGSLLPTGLRPAFVGNDRKLRQYAMIAAPGLCRSMGAAGPSDVELWLTWAYAIAQHYGPGTTFLDVTTSMEVALWFALSQPSAAAMVGVIGPPGPIDPTRDVRVEEEWVSFTPREHGFLYVLDVPIREDGISLRHGELLDLSSAPWIFSSTRVAAQGACLVRADPKEAGGDLRAFLVVPPIPVSRKDERPSLAVLDPDQVFPPPARDPWYNRFVSIPLVPQLDDGARAITFRRPIPVTIYASREDSSIREVGLRQIVQDPPLLWPYLVDEALRPKTWVPPGFNPAGAVHITLEFAAYAITPPLDSGTWNEAVAVDSLPDSCQSIDRESGLTSTLSLTKTVWEFSPLELAAWDAAEISGPTSSYLRALYLDRPSGLLVAWAVLQEVPRGTVSIIGPLKFALRAGEKSLAGPPSEFAKKGLLTVLTLLRELSDSPVPCPFPTITVDGRHVVRLQGGSHLVCVSAPRGGQTHFMRDETGNPFDASSMGFGIGILRSPKSWASLDPGQLMAGR